MGRDCTVSVVITTRNSAGTIGRCLDSLLPYQQEGLIEDVVLVDSHSTDGTPKIAGRYPVVVLQEESKDHEQSVIRVYHSTYGALDQGWRSARGDVVMFLDSDAYLGQGIFPEAMEFFSDPRLGVLGCWQRPVGDNWLSRAMGQLLEFHGQQIQAVQEGRSGLWGRVYRFAAWFGGDSGGHVPIGGPCYMVRRECLEAVNGHDAHGDVGIAARAVELGWRSQWWVGAPVCHPPRQGLWALARERWSWGQTAAFRPHKLRHYLSVPASLVWSLLLGLWLTIKYRNPLHLVVCPLTVGAHVAGGVGGRLAKLWGAR
jgi:cellulose synthase/poly-beta-1,6-N-acetylglucosamine synthase-like glycosyltransferase